ncbi:hypothetical protein [Nocardioides lijunqiniae]|uniref:hypothetical protein n=1 Tax=Nocardioides lijunqiniae TaxID=2760832 RepID=UPI001877615A|nr:hypothetical protein [Nocardioides lijunqiniae]
MPDPISELESFDPGGPVTPLPAAEVRRRGDRHRRRRTAGVALAAAAAVAVVATGGALLFGGDPADVQPAEPRPSLTVDPTCSSSDDGCAGTPEAPDSDPADIPDDLPLASGWPTEHEPGDEHGLTGPGEDVPALEEAQACGTALPAADALDRLAAGWANPEDYRSRLLLTFQDAQAAIDYQGLFLEPYRACPREETPDGYTTLVDVRRTAVGGESWAVVRSFESEGSPAIGLEVLHVVRVGRSLLVDVTSSEGMADDADSTIAAQTADAAEVVAAMCAFTEAGCVK